MSRPSYPKKMTINQSMDVGADPKMFASGPDQYL